MLAVGCQLLDSFAWSNEVVYEGKEIPKPAIATFGSCGSVPVNSSMPE